MLDRRLISIASLVLVSFAASCGDSDEGTADSGSDAGPDTGTTPATDASMDTGMTPVATTIMCGATTCSAPMPPSLGDAGLPALPIPIDPSMLAGMGALPCCTGADATNPCGVMSSTLFPTAGCIEADMPGVPDDSCPTIDANYTPAQFPIMVPISFPGCCTAKNQCGLDLSAIKANLDMLLPGLGTIDFNTGVGCMELTQADMLGGGSVMVLTDAGTTSPIPCGLSDDGGADDGG